MRWLPIRTLAIRALAIRTPATRALAIQALAIAGLLLMAWPASAQLTRDEIALRNQLYELQQQVQTLQQQAGTGGGSYLGHPGGPPPAQAGGGGDIVPQLLARVQTLEEEVRTLRGRVDEVQNQVQQQAADLGKRIDDLTFQVQNGQAGGAPGQGAAPAGGGAPIGASQGSGHPAYAPQGYPSQGYPSQGYPSQGYAGQGQAPGGAIPLQPGPVLSPPPGTLGATQAQPAPPPGPPVRRTPELAMQDGNAALARRDYPAAEAAAHEVLNNFRTSPRAYDAQYVLAQALAGERQYSQAAIAYDDTYNRNRKGAHAPDALVGLASSLAAINEKRAACDTIGKLHAEFPQERAELREAAVAVQQRAGCR
jgi:TolA-binding protein